ncbi:NUDIX hydrolase [Luteimonas sp. XNQY3]|nr:NUDIX hydrolase [Luteimonas sp. XNQY3]MCD9008144.1 NUDIX hydrolase [Luteimonas sp. XNQY3]
MKDRVHSELKAITPLDPIEKEHLQDALAWVESGAPLFRINKPATPPKHLVSYFALIADEHILLVDHKNAELWLPTGGHVEPGEDPRITVVRELKEELGIDIQPSQVGVPQMVTVTETVGLTAGHTDVSLWYAVAGNRSKKIEFDAAEFHDARWFPFADVPFHRSEPHLHRFLAKLRGSEA